MSERAADRTVLLSTHQTEDVAAMCPRVVVMLDGRALFEGTPREPAMPGKDEEDQDQDSPHHALGFGRQGAPVEAPGRDPSHCSCLLSP